MWHPAFLEGAKKSVASSNTRAVQASRPPSRLTGGRGTEYSTSLKVMAMGSKRMAVRCRYTSACWLDWLRRWLARIR